MRRTKRPRIYKTGLAEAQQMEFFAATHLRHVGNDERWYGKPFFLEEFQRRNIWYPIFGTGRMSSGRFVRRYRTALVGMPRDFGKTEIACAMLLTEANMHPVYNGQYGIVAYSKEQAAKILLALKTMVALDPDLRAIWEPQKHEVVNAETGALIKVFPYSEGALQSWHFNMLVADELHVWRDEQVWNAITSGMSSIPNSLVVAITTAGGRRSGFLWDWLNGTDDLPSVYDDDEAYCWWHGAPDSADIDDRAAWRKVALPSWITLEDMERSRKRLTRLNFERYILNRFPSANTSLACFTARQLNRCEAGENEFDPSEPFALGIDGATSGDSFAIVAFQRRDGVGLTREWVFDEPDEETGHYPLGEIMELIAQICTTWYPAEVCMDPNRLIVMSNQLKDVYGIETTSFAQNNPTMCQATALVTHLVKDGLLRLKGCPKLREHLANAVGDDKGAYGTRFGKDDRRSKIDAAIALAIAVLGYDTLVDGQAEWSSFNE